MLWDYSLIKFKIVNVHIEQQFWVPQFHSGTHDYCQLGYNYVQLPLSAQAQGSWMSEGLIPLIRATSQFGVRHPNVGTSVITFSDWRTHIPMCSNNHMDWKDFWIQICNPVLLCFNFFFTFCSLLRTPHGQTSYKHLLQYH